MPWQGDSDICWDIGWEINLSSAKKDARFIYSNDHISVFFDLQYILFLNDDLFWGFFAFIWQFCIEKQTEKGRMSRGGHTAKGWRSASNLGHCISTIRYMGTCWTSEPHLQYVHCFQDTGLVLLSCRSKQHILKFFHRVHIQIMSNSCLEKRASVCQWFLTSLEVNGDNLSECENIDLPFSATDSVLFKYCSSTLYAVLFAVLETPQEPWQLTLMAAERGQKRRVNLLS